MVVLVRVSDAFDSLYLFLVELFAAPILPVCRYPRCNSRVFFDDRVNELREWCSDDHMLCVVRIYFRDLNTYHLRLEWR